MASQIINKATLEYDSGNGPKTTASNTTSVVLQGPLEVVIQVLEPHYQMNKELTYNVFLKNSSSTTLTNVSVTDNLATFEHASTVTVTPLTYVGPAKYFQNDLLISTLDADVGEDSVTFEIDSLPPESISMIQYKVKTNEYAPGAEGSILKTSVTADDFNTPVIATYDLPIGSYADVFVQKSMSPDPVVDGSQLTYTFLLENYGTRAATKTILKDTFKPIPKNIGMTIDAISVAPTAYTLDSTSGEFIYPKETTDDFQIPAAQYVQDEDTGITTVTPGVHKVQIVGTI